jgi:hypothetical protein
MPFRGHRVAAEHSVECATNVRTGVVRVRLRSGLVETAVLRKPKVAIEQELVQE